MSKGLLVGVVILAVVLIGIPLLASLTGGQPTADTAPMGGAIDGKSIVGTEWEINGEYRVVFKANGSLTINGAIPGNWSINGDTITASAMGESFSAKIKGGELISDEAPIKRIR
ncbi:MAG: hypothetical protein JXR94_05825 [Candidatus Hydrogenedentes bacterium]|nr:hypothetical protein [Candidatus Hydrogenedentota bacterium]